MKLGQTTPPAREPLSLEEVRSFLRLDHDAEDATLAALLRASREACENFTGKSLIRQGWRLTSFITESRRVALFRGPLIAVDAVRLGKDRELLTAEDYEVEDAAAPARIRIKRCDVSTDADTPVEVDFTAGYGDDWNAVPLGLRQGMLRLIAHQYRFRDDPDVAAIPAAVAALWAPYREVRL